MLRTALRPKWLALLALALALASGFAWLGSWQLDRSRAESTERGLRAEAAITPVPLSDVLAPQQALAGPAGTATVVVVGDLDADLARLSPRRELDGRDGSWVIVPVEVATDGGHVGGPVRGARLPVLLGWQQQDVLPDLRSGPVSLTGALRSSEAPSGTPADDVVLETVSTADLVNLWGAPLYSAYLVASEADARAAGLDPVSADPERRGFGFDLQNLSYAVQWWVFAGFAVFLWWRLVRDDHLDRLEQDAVLPDERPADQAEDQQADPVRSATP